MLPPDNISLIIDVVEKLVLSGVALIGFGWWFAIRLRKIEQSILEELELSEDKMAQRHQANENRLREIELQLTRHLGAHNHDVRSSPRRS